MIFQQISRSDADRFFSICKNGEASRLVPGTPVCFDFNTDANGNTVILPLDSHLRMFAGIVGNTIGTSGQPDQYGKVQVYGYAPTIYVGTSTVTPGAILMAVSGATFLKLGLTHAASTTETPTEAYCYVIAGTTYNAGTNNAPGAIRGIIRAM